MTLSFITSFGHPITVYSYNMILAQWSKRWLLSFNVTICKVLRIGNSTVHCSHQYTPQEVTLEFLDDMRDQGTIINSKLKFHAHSDSVTNKANDTLGLIIKSLSVRALILNFWCVHNLNTTMQSGVLIA